MASSKREQLVQTALDLFCRDGFHATGIDRIVAESGVAKMTLYKHFRSKEELILAALGRRDERFRDWISEAVEGKATEPADRLTAIFDVLSEWFADQPYCGCPFINAAAEFAGPDHPVHVAAARHKRLVWEYVRDLAQAAGARNPNDLAEQILLLMEGAIVVTQVTGDREAARQARGAAEILVRQATSQ